MQVATDKGYQGLQKLHPNSQVPVKKPKGGELSMEDKHFNRSLSRQRIVIEHINPKSLRLFLSGIVIAVAVLAYAVI